MRSENRRNRGSNHFVVRAHPWARARGAFQRLLKNSSFTAHPVAPLALVISLSSFMWITAGAAQGPSVHISMVRALKTVRLGIENPTGIAFSLNERLFHVVESRGASQVSPLTSDVVSMTGRPDQKERTRIPAVIDDPINMTFDDVGNRLLALQSTANMLIRVKAEPDGRLNPATVERFDIRHFGLQNPQGMAVDPRSGDLLILDSAGPAIIRVASDADGNWNGAHVARVDLSHLNATGLRGLAIDPVAGHLHVLDATVHALYEIDAAGQFVAVRDLSSLILHDPRGMVFAPSGDLTDDPSEMSLYVADSGLSPRPGGRPRSSGKIVELSLVAPLAAEATTFQSSLIRTTDMALFSPPSPDPSGLTYVPTTNRLVMSDGEVEETVNGITHFAGANVWEMTLSGAVVRTANISSVAPAVKPFSNEPTGVAWNPGNGHYYFSDDGGLRVFDLNPGADGLIGTADDTFTSFSTHASGNDDPEGITYDSVRDRLFVVDGTNREVYEYMMDGTLAGQFDVEVYGVADPESVEFNAATGSLFVLSNSSNRIIIETTVTGTLLQTINVSASNSVAPAGLAYAPASSGTGLKSFYIVDRGIDNNDNPNIVDGKMYEMTAPVYAPGNNPPTVSAGSDQTITISQSAQLHATTSDDGLPNPPGTVTVAWNKLSGPGTVTFSDAASKDPTATFSTTGTYVLRVVASDGQLTATDDVVITVTPNPGEYSLEIRVAASADDAEESASGGITLTSTDLELVYDGSNQTVGMRFNSVSIPSGATITNASIQFTVDESQTEATLLTIQGQSADQAAQFTNVSRDLSSRPRTTAAVSWSPNAWTTIGAAAPDQKTPNISAVIQEIVNRTGWASGNSLVVIITGTGHRTAQAYDFTPTTAPLLHVDYRTGPLNHAPVAVADSYNATEDTSLVVGASGVLGNDSDPDSNPLTAVLNSGPSHGTLALSANGGFTYTPAANYNGADSFTYHANDGSLDSNVVAVSITVAAVNDPPVANPQSVMTSEDTAKTITLTGSDAEGSVLTFAVVTGPAHGTLNSTVGANLTYTPAANYNGADSFTFKVNDGTADSNTATVSITVTPVNDTPVANPQSVSTPENTPKSITLTGTDIDGDALTYAVASAPAHGTLSGTAPNMTYSPAANYSGPDSFTFTVKDATLTSSPATVSISVSSVNHAPVASDQSVTTAEDTAKLITLAASDQDGNTLTYIIVSGPAHGTLSGTGANQTYTPAANYNGTDSFTFKANDGTLDSNTATVSITVTAVNDTPVANSQSVSTNEDTAKAITLTGSDVDGDALTYTVVTPPAHGSLSGSTPNLTYTPAGNYNGADSFAFTVKDATLTSSPATVSITVTAVNDPPVANPQSVNTSEDTPIAIFLTGSDVEGSALTFAVVTPPAHGALSGTPPNLTYSPALNYSGADSFTFKVNDGAVDSAPATVSISITAVNDPPVANPQSVTVTRDTPTAITLTASDPDGNPLTYTVLTQPANGILSGTVPDLTYTPAAGYVGPDSFTFRVNDGTADSNTATVSITVQPPANQAPTANAGPDKTIVYPNMSVGLSGTVTDDGLPGPTLTYTWTKVSGPGSVTITPNTGTTTSGATINSNATFTKTGSYTLRLTVSDGSLSGSDDVVVSVRKK